MKPKLAIGCLALGMTLAPAAIPTYGPDGKLLPQPPLSRRQLEAAPAVRYTADSLTLILYRFTFNDNLPESQPVSLDSINGEMEKSRRLFSEWSGGRFRFIPKIHPTTVK